MLLKSSILVVFLFLFVTKNEALHTQNQKLDTPNKSPLALVDDARDLLDNLVQLTLGNILVAHNELENLRYEATSQRVNVRLNAEVDIQTQHLNNAQDLVNLKELALTAEANITECLHSTESRLNEIPDVYLDLAKQCISDTQVESDQIIIDGSYNVDILISEVAAISFALGRCVETDAVCINGVIEQINQISKNLPLQIKVEIAKVTDSIDIIKVKIQDCSDTSIAAFVKEGSDIIQDISNCIETIIS